MSMIEREITQRDSEALLREAARGLMRLVDNHVDNWVVRDGDDDHPMEDYFQTEGMQRVLKFQKNLGEAVARFL